MVQNLRIDKLCLYCAKPFWHHSFGTNRERKTCGLACRYKLAQKVHIERHGRKTYHAPRKAD